MAFGTEAALAQFDRWGPKYDRSWLQRLLFEPSHDLVLAHLGHDDQRLLDIGAGTGVFADRALRHSDRRTVYALDLSPKMLAQAVARQQSWPGRLEIVRADSQLLPFADDSLDVVTCCHSFHHYPDQARVVSEMHRVLRPGGRLFLLDGDRDRPVGRLIFDVAVPLIEGPVHHCSAKEFRQLLEQAGFEQIEQVFRSSVVPIIMTTAVASASAMQCRHAA